MKITDELIKNSCSPTIYKRGMDYFREGRVHLRKRNENSVNAVVDGESLYNVMVKFNYNKVTDSLCTCPYFETMNCACKHIVATLKQLQTELELGENFNTDNSALASSLCNEFASKNQSKNIIHIKFLLYINQPTYDTTYFSMALETDKSNGAIQGIENFLEHYSKGLSYPLDKQTSFTPGITDFISPQKEIIDILAETYENRTISDELNAKATYQTSFGQASAVRILSLLKNTDFALIYNGMNIPDIRITSGDPDIIVDITPVDSGICLCINERGYALTRNGEFFLFDGIIYNTTKEWQSYFMPIYKTLALQNRTQITFEGASILSFATYVLPHIQGKQGFITSSIDDLIIDEKPIFEIYFDLRGSAISAVIIARYGNISQRLPIEQNNISDAIVVRDIKEETNILSYFSGFSYKNGSFFLSESSKIYNFLKYSLPDLKKCAKVVSSVSFEKIFAHSSSVNFSVSYNSELNLLEADFDTTLSDDDLLGILSAIKVKESFYRLTDGTFVSLEKSDETTPFSLLEQLEFSDFELLQKHKQLLTYHAMYLDSLSYVTKSESFLEYVDKIKQTKADIPDFLADVLREYQKTGLDWFKQLSSLGFGGILADDMGLGKTLQVLAYICSEKPSAPVLIVTPSALTYNWYSEIERFTPSLNARIIDGIKSERNSAIKEITDNEVIITSYPLLRRDISLYSSIEFSYCFIDEAQYIKNPKTKNSLCVKKIKAGHKFALTGTPIENSLSELWSIFDFVMPQYLGKLSDFRSKYIPQAEDSSPDLGLEALRSRVRPFILRRMKVDVLEELPDKIEHIAYAELSAEQKKMYSAYITLAKRKTISLFNSGNANKLQILTLLTRLRQICCHPALFDENYIESSSKLELLLEILHDSISSGHRVLVFSQYTSMLSIIREQLEKMHIKSFYLDGKTPSYERLEMADRFNYGERDVFLISLKAGGTGLNLTGADTVIHYDPWWNPAAMDQASDRAYRIGQTKAVQIIKLVSKGTIEEKIIKLQENKRMLANDIIQINNDTLSSLSKDEILSLFEP